MVENPDVNQRQRLFEVLREQFIGTARFRYSRRMIMRVMCPGFLCAGEKRIRRRSEIVVLDQGT